MSYAVRLSGFGADTPDCTPGPDCPPITLALIARARQLYPGDEAKQAAFIFATGPGFGTPFAQWLADPVAQAKAWAAAGKPIKTGGPPPSDFSCAPGETRAPGTRGQGDPGCLVSPPPPPEKGIPWWVWVGVPVVAGGGIAIAYRQGWIGRRR